MDITADLKPTKYRVLLASNSPRRRDLLHLILPDFSIAVSKDIDEVYPPDTAPEDVPVFLSRLKATPYLEDLADDELLLTADTVVINRGAILGKPHDEAQAVDMLRSLMRHTHTVVTGVTLTAKEKTVSFAEHTEVTFGDISDKEIELYVRNFRPLDKAGAYGIQEWIGCAGITGIKGCFYNVMGLPLHSLYQHLRDF